MATYNQILIDSFEERRRTNPAYSVRAFARDLGLAPSHLYDVLSHRSGLSLRTARQIAEKLPAAVDRVLFIDLVESMHARSAAARANAKRRLASRQQFNAYVEMPVETQSLLKDWFCSAILEVLTLKPSATADYCAETLGISLEQANDGIAQLSALNVIILKNGKYERTVESQQIQAKHPSALLRNFHKQLAQLCIDRIDMIPMEERKFSSAVISFDSSRFAEARAYLDEVYDEFLRRFTSADDSDNCIYILMNNFMKVGELEEQAPAVSQSSSLKNANSLK